VLIKNSTLSIIKWKVIPPYSPSHVGAGCGDNVRRMIVVEMHRREWFHIIDDLSGEACNATIVDDRKRRIGGVEQFKQ